MALLQRLRHQLLVLVFSQLEAQYMQQRIHILAALLISTLTACCACLVCAIPHSFLPHPE
jgi:hypothetical protein